MFYLLHVVEIIVIINTKNCFVCLQMEHGKKTPVCVTIIVCSASEHTVNQIISKESCKTHIQEGN